MNIPSSFQGLTERVARAVDTMALVIAPVSLALCLLLLHSSEHSHGALAEVLLGISLGSPVLISLLKRHIGPVPRLCLYGASFVAGGAVTLTAEGLASAGLFVMLLGVMICGVASFRAWIVSFAVAILAVVAWGVWSGRAFPPGLHGAMHGITSLLAFSFAAGVTLLWHWMVRRMMVSAEDRAVAEREYRAMFENAGDALLICEGDHWIDCNPMALAVLKCEKAQLLGKPAHVILQPRQSDGSVAAEVLKEAMESARTAPVRAEWLCRRCKGDSFAAEVTLSWVTVGGRSRVMFALRDVSEQRRLQEEHRMMATALEQAGESVMITDSGARLVYVNHAFEEIMGFRRAEVLTKNPSVLKSGTHSADFYSSMWTDLLGGRAWRGRLTNSRKDGAQIVVDCCITPLRNTQGRITHFVGVQRDVTEQIKAEQQLAQAQKMEALGQLAGGVAHDFNNILQVIAGNVEMARLCGDGNDELSECMSEIATAADRAGALTRHLLAFSRKSEQSPIHLDVNELTRGIARMLQRLMGPTVALSIRTLDAPLHLMADPGQIEQVLLNLCVNARDAMPSGGCIDVSIGHVRSPLNQPVALGSLEDAEYVTITVRDNGCGIPPDVRAKIFDPFFTTKPVGVGTGLGLATVATIVNRHRGAIALDSDVGKGTTFTVYFPASAAGAAPSHSVNALTTVATRGNGETILVVEDDEGVRDLTVRILTTAGYKVVVASDGPEGCALFQRERAAIDLILLDLIMPGQNGRDVYIEMRQTGASMPFLFMTGYSGDQLLDGIIPVESVLQKPIAPRELLARIAAALSAHRQRLRDPA